MEFLNLMIANDVELVKTLDMTMCSSVKARRNTSVLYEDNILDYEGIPVDDDCRNRNVEILNIKLACMGLELCYYDEETGETIDIDSDDDYIDTASSEYEGELEYIIDEEFDDDDEDEIIENEE